MRECYRVEELNLYERVLWVNIEVDIHHDVEDDDQAKNNEVWPDTFHLFDDKDGWKREKHFEYFDVDRVNFITSCVRAICSRRVIFGGRSFVSF